MPELFFCQSMFAVRTLLTIGVMHVSWDLHYWCLSITPLVVCANLFIFLARMICFAWFRSDSDSVMILSLFVLQTPGTFSSITSSTCFHHSGQKPNLIGIDIIFACIEHSDDFACGSASFSAAI